MDNLIKLKKYYISEAGFDPGTPEFIKLLDANLSNIKLGISKGLDLGLVWVQDMIINDYIDCYFHLEPVEKL